MKAKLKASPSLINPSAYMWTITVGPCNDKVVYDHRQSENTEYRRLKLLLFDYDDEADCLLLFSVDPVCINCKMSNQRTIQSSFVITRIFALLSRVYRYTQ